MEHPVKKFFRENRDKYEISPAKKNWETERERLITDNESLRAHADNLRTQLRQETARLNHADKEIERLNRLNDKYRQDTQEYYGAHGGTMKFRKKPIVNEAIRWTGENLKEVIAFTGLHPSAQKWTWEEYEEVVKHEGLKIFTLEGPLFASVGDYIMRGVSGEFYPIKPDILVKTYDRVD
jgi:predicted aminopeptidase